EVPEDIIELLIDWSANDPNPDLEEEQQKIQSSHETERPQSAHHEILISLAMNSVRGTVLPNLCKILFKQNPVDLERIFEILTNGIADPCASVAAITVEQLIEWQNKTRDRDRSIGLLEEALAR